MNNKKIVPLLDLTRQYSSLKSELDAALLRVAASQQFILGPDVAKFESECAAFLRSKFTLGVSSGTDALIQSLMALDIGPGDEVITSAYSFFATAGAIVRVGAKPVFVDIEADSFNINPRLIEPVITPATKAIIPVHLFGQCAEMDDILRIAHEHKLAVIEDAAQAFGSTLSGEMAGTMGDIGCFSFFPSKNLGAFGDAGLVTTNSEELFEKLKMDRVHGSRTKYFHERVGGNFRLDSLQAAVLRVKLAVLEPWTDCRRLNAIRYMHFFRERSMLVQDSNYPVAGKLVVPKFLEDRKQIFNQFVIRINNRDRVMATLKENGIGCEVYYPVPLHLQRCFSGLGYGKGDLPESERAALESLALPIFPELEEDEIYTVCHCLERILREA